MPSTLVVTRKTEHSFWTPVFGFCVSVRSVPSFKHYRWHLGGCSWSCVRTRPLGQSL